MNYKTLLLGTVVIAVVTYGAYSVITPKLQTEGTEAVKSESPEKKDSVNITPDSTQGQVFELNRGEDGEVVVKEKTEASAPAADPSPKTDPAPKPAPAPISEEVMSTSFTLSEVAQHSTESSCWTAVNGFVYDLTPFIKKHPGGKENIMRICGVDGTKAFEGQHGGDSKPENTLAGFEIGLLK